MKSRRRSLLRYLPESADLLTHFRIAPGAVRHGFASLPCLLARAWTGGRFELLSPGWSALGYADEELAGRVVCDLLDVERSALRGTMKSLLTEGGGLEIGLRRKDGREARYYWNREFDDFSSSMFIIGDELSAARGASARSAGAGEGGRRLPSSHPE
jgi:hypothetical protein